MLKRVIDAIDTGIFWPGEGGLFTPLMHALRHHDYYMISADFDDYVATHLAAGRELEGKIVPPGPLGGALALLLGLELAAIWRTEEDDGDQGA